MHVRFFPRLLNNMNNNVVAGFTAGFIAGQCGNITALTGFFFMQIGCLGEADSSLATTAGFLLGMAYSEATKPDLTISSSHKP